MSPQRSILFLYLILLLGTDAVVCAVAFWREQPIISSLLRGMMLGLSLSQMGLAAAFLVWGRWPLVLRTLAILTTAMGISVTMWMSGWPHSSWPNEAAVVLCVIAAVALPLFALRLLGLRLFHIDEQPDRTANPWQFSMGGIISVITSAALVLAIARHTEFYAPLETVVFNIPIFAAPVWIAITCVFAFGRIAVGMVLLGGLTLAYVLAVTQLFGPGTSLIGVGAWIIVETASLTIGLVLVRWSGFRLRWSNSTKGNTLASNRPTFREQDTDSLNITVKGKDNFRFRGRQIYRLL